MRTQHDVVRNIFCEVEGCAKSRTLGFRGFIEPREMTRHRQAQHGAARTIFCEVEGCAKSQALSFRGFIQSQELTRHMRTQHGVEKPLTKRKLAESISIRQAVAPKTMKVQTQSTESDAESSSLSSVD